MPYSGDQRIVAAVKQGVEFPPLVVFCNRKREGRSLLDGANRTNAYAVLGVHATLAYELILDGLTLDSLLR